MFLKILFIFALLVAKCTGNAPIQDATTAQASAEERGIMASVSQSPNFPYDLNNPNAAFDLDISLREISGLTTTPKAENLAAVQDEKGQLFYINKKREKVTPSVIFAEDGDFEGVEFVGDTLWVVKSKGRLFKLWNLDKTPYDRASFKIESLKKANIEGLGYDAKNNRLLLAQKGEKTDDATSRALFAFDLRNQTPSVSKAYDIGLSDFQAFLSDKKEKRYRHLIEDYITDPVTRGVEFGPSGVAIHPPTGNLYVLSSMNKTLVILSAEGKILEMVKLDKNRFPQPEGICFDADGTLYLSSEAKDDPKGKVFVFKQQR